MREVGRVGKPVDPASHLGARDRRLWRREQSTENQDARHEGRGGNWRGEGVETLSTRGLPLEGASGEKCCG